MGRKGSASALRDAVMMKTAHAYGLRRSELARLDLADLRPNPHEPGWGTYGAVHVRFDKSVAGPCWRCCHQSSRMAKRAMPR
jgi:integrase/recombinase XerC